jgi:SAM-dependent methyltransferase
LDRNDWNARYASTELVWGTDPNRFVAAELEGTARPGRALDLACGEGRNSIWLAARGWRVTGVDFSDVAIERARQIASSRGVDVEWLVADLASWQPDQGAYDLVLIAYLQLPTDALRRVVTHAAAALAPGGELLMIGHARDNLAGGYGGPKDPAVLWTPAETAEMLRAAGLRIERCEHVDRPVASPEGPRVAIDVLARARRSATA